MQKWFDSLLRKKCALLADRIWYGSSHPLRYLLLPFSLVFFVAVKLRRSCFLRLPQVPFSSPVIVVGNLVAGGTGKTPLVIAIACRLKSRGYSPGIASRGYGAERVSYPCQVQADNADRVGDEPVLLSLKTGCPVVIDPDRKRAVDYLTDRYSVDVVICDDGLQHYRLHRDVEIALIDGSRAFGNGWLIPAGPLREPRSRLASVDIAVVRDGQALADAFVGELPGERCFSMQMRALRFRNLETGEHLPLDAFSGQVVHACAGIARPEAFFRQLSALGVRVIEHAYPDHHRYREADLHFEERVPVIVTEKDAIKCCRFRNEDVWALEAEAVPAAGFWVSLDRLLSEIKER